MNKYEEALDYLRWIGSDGYYKKNREKSFDILQELVDKATPKKIISYWECPNCGNGYETHNGEYGDNFNYCGNCGQHLDWSDEE